MCASELVAAVWGRGRGNGWVSTYIWPYSVYMRVCFVSSDFLAWEFMWCYFLFTPKYINFILSEFLKDVISKPHRGIKQAQGLFICCCIFSNCLLDFVLNIYLGTLHIYFNSEWFYRHCCIAFFTLFLFLSPDAVCQDNKSSKMKRVREFERQFTEHMPSSLMQMFLILVELSLRAVFSTVFLIRLLCSLLFAMDFIGITIFPKWRSNKLKHQFRL